MDSAFERDEVYFWVRTFKRIIDRSPGYLSVNGLTLPFAATPAGTLSQWIWERVGPFPNEPGLMRITIARPYAEVVAQFMAVFIDSIIITDDAEFQPEVSRAHAMPPTHYLLRGDYSQGEIPLDFPSGRYTCHLEIESTEPLVEDRKSTRLNSSHIQKSRMPSSA